MTLPKDPKKVNEGTCTCMFYVRQGHACKHVCYARMKLFPEVTGATSLEGQAPKSKAKARARSALVARSGSLQEDLASSCVSQWSEQ